MTSTLYTRALLRQRPKWLKIPWWVILHSLDNQTKYHPQDQHGNLRELCSPPNLHTAHHWNIGSLWRVHLNKAEVRTFAITLKDFTLDHNPDNLTHTDAATSNYRPSRYQQESLRKSIIHVQTRPPWAPNSPAASRHHPISSPPATTTRPPSATDDLSSFREQSSPFCPLQQWLN